MSLIFVPSIVLPIFPTSSLISLFSFCSHEICMGSRFKLAFIQRPTYNLPISYRLPYWPIYTTGGNGKKTGIAFAIYLNSHYSALPSPGLKEPSSVQYHSRLTNYVESCNNILLHYGCSFVGLLQLHYPQVVRTLTTSATCLKWLSASVR